VKNSTIIVLVVAALLAGMIAGYGAKSFFAGTEKNVDTTTENDNNDNNTNNNDGIVTTTTTPPPREAFNAANAMQQVRYLSMSIGPRPEGTAPDRKTADYIHSEFSSFGYADVREQSFPLKNGQTSYNVYVEDKGTNPAWTVIVGAHYDTLAGKNTPGANDNGSGVGTVLELARVFKTNDQLPNLRFAAFGAEEITQGYSIPDHHYGSKYMAAQLAGESENVIGMISIDMIGVGTSLYVNATLLAPKTFLDLFYAYAREKGVIVSYRQDPGWSDHDSFEAHGISSFWIEYQEDPNYHTPGDTFDKVNPELVSRVGNLVQGFLESLDAETCAYLDSISNYK
jgi:hypothetical protein